VNIEVLGTAFGRPALDRLHSLISTIKADDPLAPVSVLVPSNYVGVSTRRLIASGELGPVGAHAGLAGIDLLTTYRLAELIGAPRLAGRGLRPLSTPIIAAVVRGVLHDTSTMFGAVREHPSTERALIRVYREMRDLTAEQLDVLAQQSERAREVVSIHRVVYERLSDQWYDEFDLFDAATEIVTERPALVAERGHIIVYLPQVITAAGIRLLDAVSVQTPVTVLAGYTGTLGPDALTNEIVTEFVAQPPHMDVTPTTGSRVVTASDADDEVRTVLRDVMDALVEGIVEFFCREPLGLGPVDSVLFCSEVSGQQCPEPRGFVTPRAGNCCWVCGCGEFADEGRQAIRVADRALGGSDPVVVGVIAETVDVAILFVDVVLEARGPL